MRIRRVLLISGALLAAGLALGIGAVAATAATPCDEWTWLNPLPQGSDLAAACYGSGRFVAVGRSGAVLASADGLHWTVGILDPADWLSDVVWANGLFVAVGDGVWTSPDGIEWTRRFDGGSYTIGWNGREFLVPCGTGFLRSADGVTWEVGPAINPYGIFSLASDGRRWVGTGTGVMTSSDGLDWARKLSPITLWDVIWTGGQFVAVGAMNRHGLALRSADGSDWAIGTTDLEYGDAGLLGVAANGSGILAVAETAVVHSGDGRRWAEEYTDPSIRLKGVAANADAAVAVGSGGVMLLRDAGGQWTTISRGTVVDLNRIRRVGGELLIAGGTPFEGGVVLSREDGGEWKTLLETGPSFPNFYAVTRRDSTYVAVGAPGTVMAADGGANWTSGTGIPSEAWLYAVTTDGTQFVTVGSSGLIATSSQGTEWTVRTHPGPADAMLRDVVWNGSLFVAVGGDLPTSGPGPWDSNHAVVMTSTDGTTWTVRYDDPSKAGLHAVVWNGGQFVAVGGSGQGSSVERGLVLRSTDGLTWAEVAYGAGRVAFYDVAWDGSAFEALVTPRRLLRSSDGATWVDDGNIGPGGVQSIAASQQELIAVGSGGLILRRACKLPRARHHLR